MEEKLKEKDAIEKIAEKTRPAPREEVEWIPKTDAGKKVKNGEINSYDELIESHMPIIEPRIIDALLPNLTEKVVDFKKTAKVRSAGRMFSFRISVLIGDGEEFIGIGTAKDKEKMPATRKAGNKARLNLVRIKKGCGSWECGCNLKHSIPFKVKGKSASVKISLMPAPKGTGLVVGSNIKDVFGFVGIKDIWSRTKGSTGTKLNFIKAAIDALSKTSSMKVSKEMERKFEHSGREKE